MSICDSGCRIPVTSNDRSAAIRAMMFRDVVGDVSVDVRMWGDMREACAIQVSLYLRVQGAARRDRSWSVGAVD